MKTKVAFLIAGFSLFVVATFAHHAFNAEYDANKLTRWAGTVTKVEWTNPHARFYVDVKDESGTVTSWNFELGSTVQLRRQGWTRDSLKAGDQITVEGYPAKDGAKLASAKKVILADGHSVFSETPTDARPADSNHQ